MNRHFSLTALLVPVVAFGQPPQPPHTILDSTDFAQVVSAIPIDGPTVPRQICAPATLSKATERVGAVPATGDRHGPGIGNESATATHVNCETLYEAGPPAGYRVTYEYLGQRATVTMAYSPGSYLKIRKIVTIE